MAQFALSKLISYLLVIFVVLMIIIMFLSQMGLVKNPLTTWIDSTKEDLGAVNQDGVSDEPGDSALISSRKNALEIFSNLDVESMGICRIDYQLPSSLGIEEKGYTYAIQAIDGKLYFKYDDVTQGMSFVKEATNLKRVHILQDHDNVLDRDTFYMVMSDFNKKNFQEPLAVYETDKQDIGVDFKVKQGDLFYFYEKGKFNPHLRKDGGDDQVENFDDKYFFKTAFKIDDTLLLFDGDSVGFGTKEADLMDKINLINICGG